MTTRGPQEVGSATRSLSPSPDSLQSPGDTSLAEVTNDGMKEFTKSVKGTTSKDTLRNWHQWGTFGAVPHGPDHAVRNVPVTARRHITHVHSASLITTTISGLAAKWYIPKVGKHVQCCSEFCSRN